MRLLQKKGKNSFVLRLHKNLYKKEALERLLKEDKKSVRISSSPKEKDFYFVELKTGRLKDVLEWSNYLFYLNKTI